MPTSREMAELATSLKLKIQQNKLRLRRAGVSPDLPSEMLQALELLESKFNQERHPSGSEAEQLASDNLAVTAQSAEPPKLPAKFLKRLAEKVESSIESALESAMQPWQSELSSATSRSLELLSAMQESIKAFAQMEEDYAERAARLDEQRQQLAVEQDKAQSLKWRLARQRKTLAQAIRAERAEMQLELAKAHAALDQRLTEQMEEEWAKADEELTQLRQQLESATRQIEQLQTQLSDAQAIAQSASKSGNDASCEQGKLLEELKRELSDTQDQLFRSAEQLSNYDALLSDKDKQLRETLQLLSSKDEEIAAQSIQLQDAITRFELLQKALDVTSDRQQDPINQEEVEQWKNQLEKAEAELVDLRQQNSELASRIAQLTADSLSTRKGHGPVNPELLSWDERKKMILQQLEQDDELGAGTLGITQEERIDLQEIIRTTQTEIERRDREIEELREIIQLQSEARQGMAIGAAGVAQMLDSNELINEERRKLQEIQQEWEAKLRQAEIDLSMERAKLARERSELELELAQLKRSSVQDQNAGRNTGDKQQRRWKNFLGLKEESSG